VEGVEVDAGAAGGSSGVSTVKSAGGFADGEVSGRSVTDPVAQETVQATTVESRAAVLMCMSDTSRGAARCESRARSTGHGVRRRDSR
jgi:hypothetical protein